MAVDLFMITDKSVFFKGKRLEEIGKDVPTDLELLIDTSMNGLPGSAGVSKFFNVGFCAYLADKECPHFAQRVSVYRVIENGPSTIVHLKKYGERPTITVEFYGLKK